MKYVIVQQRKDAIAMTNVTAHPIPNAVLSFREHPRNGQIPTKHFSTKLLMMAVLTTRSSI